MLLSLPLFTLLLHCQAWRLTPATGTLTAVLPRWCTPFAGPQPTVSGSEGGQVGETTCWAKTKGWDVIPSFGGSDCATKK
jgi:hypothetical protein